jgi:hypothetical protein
VYVIDLGQNSSVNFQTSMEKGFIERMAKLCFRSARVTDDAFIRDKGVRLMMMLFFY